MTEMESMRESLLLIRSVVTSLIKKIDDNDNCPDVPTKKEIKKREQKEKKRYYMDKIVNNKR